MATGLDVDGIMLILWLYLVSSRRYKLIVSIQTNQSPPYITTARAQSNLSSRFVHRSSSADRICRVGRNKDTTINSIAITIIIGRGTIGITVAITGIVLRHIRSLIIATYKLKGRATRWDFEIGIADGIEVLCVAGTRAL